MGVASLEILSVLQLECRWFPKARMPATVLNPDVNSRWEGIRKRIRAGKEAILWEYRRELAVAFQGAVLLSSTEYQTQNSDPDVLQVACDHRKA